MSTAAQHPHLTVVPPMPTAAPAPLEGVVAKDAPIALRSDNAIARVVEHVRLVGRGYSRLGRHWLAGLHDYHPHMIASAEQALALCSDIDEQEGLRDAVETRRARYARHRLVYKTKTGMWATTAATAATAGTLSGGFWVSLAAGLGAYLYGIRQGVQGDVPAGHGAIAGVAAPLGLGDIPAAVHPQEDALLAALVKADIITEAQRAETRIVGGIRQDGPGWAARIELPEGMPAVKATSKVNNLAGALRKKAAQLEFRPDTSETGHEGMATLWVADSPNPHAGPKVYSELIDAPRWHFWRDGIPLGMDARQARQILRLIWSSILVGGLQDYGKSYLARLIAAAAALDPTVRIIVITGKTGPDWAPLKAIAHRWIAGADPNTIRSIFSLMDDTITEMQERGTKLDRIFEQEPHRIPEGKITPELAEDGMGPVLLIVEELQELLDGAAVTKMAMPDDDSDNPRLVSAKGPLVDIFARFNRMTRFVLGMGLYITQRPDADSVPTELREVCVKRACFRTKSPESSKMVLGDLAVAAGAAPHALFESSKGVFVLDEGAEDGYRTLRGDVIDLPDFVKICERGRQLRIAAGTLTGDAAARDERAQKAAQARALIAGCLDVMTRLGRDAIQLDELVAQIGKPADELVAAFGTAEVVRPEKVTIDGKRVRGYDRACFEAVLKAA
ncbi:hypothetical protein GT352_28130 [Streptomyces sp. SID1046]|uniref:hypothetical protein n=1 Tax=Streptomyces sp. SID1046 TaxID=2690249 RepID=UPI00136A6567|nr:hypothetical protein [Streptomyces sp. SID1046]MYV77770.1 hypothetical protein [Streptomyces sp. SID1046]